MKYEKFDILKKAKYSIIPNNRELYIVYVKCDANDGDYMRDTIEFDKSSFGKMNFSYQYYPMLVNTLVSSQRERVGVVGIMDIMQTIIKIFPG